ncbi:collectin-12-like [Cloeon dipterum]|uniref:collectin-12-like n=1 Tax=Cloeon dipterum TaxID=197152 RepID=UPI0032206F24
MHLASPKTQSELTLLFQKVKQFLNGEKEWWVSASDVGSRAGDFKWHDSQALPKDSALWNKERREPNSFGQGGEACAHIAPYYKDRLMDERCSEVSNFICEQPANSVC